MGRYIFRRLFQAIPTLIGITIIIFFSIRLIPGDVCRSIHGIKVAPEVIETCREKYHFDKPIWVQYIRYLEKIFEGNFGESLIYRRSALDLISERLPVTIYLALLSTIISSVLSIPVGLLTARFRNQPVDHVFRGITTVTLSFPPFVVALALMLIFSIRLGMFPVSGYGQTFKERLHHLILPATTLALMFFPLLARGLRSALIQIFQENYLRTARSKGLLERTVFFIHAVPNALVSYISLLGLNLVVVMGATVIVEEVFAIPGLGSLMVNSIFNRDYEVIQSIALIFALLVQVINLITDIGYAAVDPRVKYE